MVCFLCCNICKTYDTICYVYMRSKADVSQLSLPHGNENKNTEKQIDLCSEETIDVKTFK